jgi:hypothetical protein
LSFVSLLLLFCLHISHLFPFTLMHVLYNMYLPFYCTLFIHLFKDYALTGGAMFNLYLPLPRLSGAGPFRLPALV